MNAIFDMDRRELLRNILLSVGATAIPAGCTLGNGPGKDFAFSTDQMALVSAIADTVIPKGDTIGALDVKVPANLEILLRSWASADTLKDVLAGLERVDAASNKAKGKGFAALDTAIRLEVLKGHEAEAMKDAPEQPPTGSLAMFRGPVKVDAGYARLRGLIVKLFYLSEEALTQELAYEHDPGGYTGSVPLTPESRPEGGLSPI
jgi:hypothetical protein